MAPGPPGLRSPAAADPPSGLPGRGPRPVDAGVVSRLRPARSRWHRPATAALHRAPCLPRRPPRPPAASRTRADASIGRSSCRRAVVDQSQCSWHRGRRLQALPPVVPAGQDEVAQGADEGHCRGRRWWRAGLAQAARGAGDRVGGSLGPVADRWTHHAPATGTTPLPPALRYELPELLVAAGGTHPWPKVIPSSRFGQRHSKPVDYTRVEPSLVVELDIDMAFEQHRWRHAARLVRTEPCSRSPSKRDRGNERAAEHWSHSIPGALLTWIHRPDCLRKRVETAEVPFDLGECGLLKLATPGSKGHLWDAIVAYRGHDARQV